MLDFLKMLLTPEFFFSIIRISAPILFATLAAIVVEKAGFCNIGLEGLMMFSALTGSLVSYYAHSWVWGLLAARAIGVLAQNHFVGYGFTVEEVVRLGRFAYAGGVFGRSREDDAGHVEQALTLTGLQDKRRQSVLTLSGGELQRTFLAQVLAQDPKLLLLDEPTNHLDLIYQKQIFALIGQWLQTPGRAVVSVVHDLSLARAFGTDALLMDSGRKIALGRANDVLTPANLDRVYGMDVAAWMRGLYSQWAE